MRFPHAHAFIAALALVASCGGVVPTAADLPTAGQSFAATATPYDWLQFGGSPAHTSNNTAETILGKGNVGQLTRLFQITLPSFVDNAPVVLTGVATAIGARDLVLVTTRAGDLVALDAHSGAVAWQQAHGAGGCKINNGSAACYTTSTPAIDPSLAFVYSYGLDGRVHKHRVGDGGEITTGGWPALATTKPFDEKSSPGLAIATAGSGATYLYAGNGGYPGDNGDYQGHITAINLADGSQHVFNALCSDQTVHFVVKPGAPDCGEVQSAVWARAGVVYDASLDRIFLATGNGRYQPSAHAFADSILSLAPDGSGAGGLPLDSYTPTNFQQLQNADADLGSTAPALLPPIGTHAHLAAQSGKDGKIRIVDLANLSGRSGPGNTGGELLLVGVPQGGEVLTAPAVWTNPADGSVWLFIGNDNGLSALEVGVDGSGAPTLTTIWQHGGGRSSPLVANGVVYAAGPNIIEALDAVSGARLWSDTSIGGWHWASPTVANGVVYIADTAARLTAFARPASPTLPPPWLDADVGAVGSAGAASFSAGTFSVSASGDDIWNTRDAFHFVYQPLDGDGQLVARVATVGNTNPWAKAGVMIRETLDPASRHAMMVLTPGNGSAFQRRTVAGGASTHTPVSSTTAPAWVRISRSGTTLTGAVSADGSSWTVVGSETIAMATSVLVGLAVTAHDNSLVNTSSLDQVSVGSGAGAVRVNFQLATTATPAGYLADSGAPFGVRGNGHLYGWNADNGANMRERNAANSPDKRYDTLGHLQKPTNPSASWELALPNGRYAVRIVAGDPSHIDSVYALDAEGVRIVGGTPNATTHWFDGTQTVTVADGRLTVTNAAARRTTRSASSRSRRSSGRRAPVGR